MPLDLRDDPHHRLDRQPRILARGRLRGEHHRVGPVQDRVRHVARLRARRARVRHHRLQHLSRGDHGTTHVVRQRDDLLLRKRNLLEWQLDAEIAARHHDGVRRQHDALDVRERRVLLDLRDNQQPLGNEGAQQLHVLRAAHEAEREVIHVLVDRERDVGAILLGQRRRAHEDAGKIHPLVAAQRPAVQHARPHAWFFHIHDDQLQQAVVDEHTVADVKVVRMPLIRHRDFGGVHGVLGRERHLGAVLERKRRRNVADANPRTLQVAKDRDRTVELFRDGPHQSDRFAVLLVRPVREVDARDVHSRFDESAECLARGRRRPERAHDLCSIERHRLGE